jgi:hypothetical protein
VDWLRETGAATRAGAELRHQAHKDGVTQLHLCMVHYDRTGERMLQWEPSTTVCREREFPLRSVVTLKTRLPVLGGRQGRRP